MVSLKLSHSESKLRAATSGSGPSAGAELMRRQHAEASQYGQEVGRENQLSSSSSSATPPTSLGTGGVEEMRQELQAAKEKVGIRTVVMVM